MEADDVVFCKVGSGLNLYQVERHLPGVLQSVNRAQRNENRFVLPEQGGIVVTLDNCRAVHNHPMFGAMIVLLEGKLGARVDRYALDLEAVALRIV